MWYLDIYDGQLAGVPKLKRWSISVHFFILKKERKSKPLKHCLLLCSPVTSGGELIPYWHLLCALNFVSKLPLNVLVFMRKTLNRSTWLSWSSLFVINHSSAILSRLACAWGEWKHPVGSWMITGDVGSVFSLGRVTWCMMKKKQSCFKIQCTLFSGPWADEAVLSHSGTRTGLDGLLYWLLCASYNLERESPWKADPEQKGRYVQVTWQETGRRLLTVLSMFYFLLVLLQNYNTSVPQLASLYSCYLNLKELCGIRNWSWKTFPLMFMECKEKWMIVMTLECWLMRFSCCSKLEVIVYFRVIV